MTHYIDLCYKLINYFQRIPFFAVSNVKKTYSEKKKIFGGKKIYTSKNEKNCKKKKRK